MIYKINRKDVSKEEFEIEFQKRIETYIPYNEYWPKKEDLKKHLQERKEIWFPTYDKRYQDRLVIIGEDCFMACEEEILEIANLVEENEYDQEDNDSLRIGIALWNAGYRKLTHQHKRIAELEEQLKNAIVLPCIKKHTTYLDIDSGFVEVAWYVIFKQNGYGDEIFTIKCRSQEDAIKELKELKGE